MDLEVRFSNKSLKIVGDSVRGYSAECAGKNVRIRLVRDGAGCDAGLKVTRCSKDTPWPKWFEYLCDKVAIHWVKANDLVKGKIKSELLGRYISVKSGCQTLHVRFVDRGNGFIFLSISGKSLHQVKQLYAMMVQTFSLEVPEQNIAPIPDYKQFRERCRFFMDGCSKNPIEILLNAFREE